MLMALLMLLPCARRPAGPDVLQLAAAGLLTGVIMVFKHNIGVFFAILCGTLLFLAAFRAEAPGTRLTGRRTGFLLLSGYFVFAVVFGSRLIHWDELVYFLLAYVLLWLLFAAFLRTAPVSFHAGQFARQALVYGACALALPAAVFIAFGQVVGYERYWHALFGMGLKYLPIWDYGIVAIIRNHVSLAGPVVAVQSLTVAFLFIVPLAVNLLAVGCVYAGPKLLALPPATRLVHFRAAALGIMATFMLFPLEGFHILSTKLFVYAWVGLFFVGHLLPRAVPAVTALMVAALLPVLLHIAVLPRTAMRMETASGTPDLKRVIGMPMQKDIAQELGNQVETLRRTTRGASYYVIDSSGGILITLAAFVDPVLPQYYIEMRKGILDAESTQAIKAAIAQRSFVVVNADDLARRDAPDADPYVREIIAFVAHEFVPVDEYRPPLPKPASFSHLLGFVIMKNRGETRTP